MASYFALAVDLWLELWGNLESRARRISAMLLMLLLLLISLPHFTRAEWPEQIPR
jgi:hypothetical protein